LRNGVESNTIAAGRAAVVVVGVNAALDRVATVGCALVSVVAVDQASRLAASPRAAIVFSATVVVATRSGVVQVHAAAIGNARIVGADFAVVTVEAIGSGAHTGGANVAGGAFIEVVARRLVVGVHAPGLHVARIVCADILVIASYRRTRLAHSLVAMIPFGAGVEIVARSVGPQVDAAGRGVATVYGARIGVLTVQ